MFGIRYLKASPTSYVLQYANGSVKREGAGLSFFYAAQTSTIALVPLSSTDVPFVFTESTADFQIITIQGQLTYRIVNPKQAASLLDFTVGAAGRHISDDPDKLKERLVSVTQVLASGFTHQLKLRDVLGAQESLTSQILAGLKENASVTALGVEILAISILAIRPSPDTAKALEAEAREMLLRQSDEAVYSRRNSAVEQERRIKESELNTEIAVEEKKRQIREKKIAADIAIEQQRVALLEQQVANDRQAADGKAYALEAMIRPLRDLDPRVVLALSAGKFDAKLGISMAFQTLAENAQKIENLNITPDLLRTLLEPDRKG